MIRQEAIKELNRRTSCIVHRYDSMGYRKRCTKMVNEFRRTLLSHENTIKDLEDLKKKEQDILRR